MVLNEWMQMLDVRYYHNAHDAAVDFENTTRSRVFAYVFPSFRYNNLSWRSAIFCSRLHLRYLVHAHETASFLKKAQTRQKIKKISRERARPRPRGAI